MSKTTYRREVKYMAAGFVAVPGELIFSEGSVRFEPHGIDSIFLRRKIDLGPSEIISVKYHRVLGIFDGFIIETTSDRFVFSATFGSDNELKSFLSSLLHRDGIADDILNVSARYPLQRWAEVNLTRGVLIDLLVTLLLAIPAYSIFWLFSRTLLTDLQFVYWGNLIFVVINWLWITDIVVLIVIFSLKIVRAPVPILVKFYGIVTVAVSGIVTIPLLHFSGRQFILRGQREDASVSTH